MLRSQGVPSRVVSGYAQGEYDDASQSYRVRASNAHTWVEVYFPNYGWIPIDPSGGDSDRPAAQASAIGYLNNRFLITTLGGGGSEFLEWSYNSNEFWQCKGPCKIYGEHIGEWSPINETEEEK